LNHEPAEHHFLLGRHRYGAPSRLFDQDYYRSTSQWGIRRLRIIPSPTPTHKPSELMIRSLKRAVPPRHPDLKEFDDSGIGNESEKLPRVARRVAEYFWNERASKP